MVQDAKARYSLTVKWLRLCPFTTSGPGSIPVRELRSHMPHSLWNKKMQKPCIPFPKGSKSTVYFSHVWFMYI